MLVSSAVFINMSLAIPQTYLIRTRWLRLLAGAGKWVLSVVLPLLLFAEVNDQANKRAEKITKEALAPVITYIDQEISKNGHPPAVIMNEVNKVKRLMNVSYLTGDKHYMLYTSIASWEIEGAKIFYTDLDKTWRIENTITIESGSTDNAKIFQKAAEGLTRRFYWVDYRSGQWESKIFETDFKEPS